MKKDSPSSKRQKTGASKDLISSKGEDVLLHILDFLGQDGLGTTAQVSKLFQQITADDTLWIKQLCDQYDLPRFKHEQLHKIVSEWARQQQGTVKNLQRDISDIIAKMGTETFFSSSGIQGFHDHLQRSLQEKKYSPQLINVILPEITLAAFNEIRKPKPPARGYGNQAQARYERELVEYNQALLTGALATRNLNLIMLTLDKFSLVTGNLNEDKKIYHKIISTLDAMVPSYLSPSLATQSACQDLFRTAFMHFKDLNLCVALFDKLPKEVNIEIINNFIDTHLKDKGLDPKLLLSHCYSLFNVASHSRTSSLCQEVLQKLPLKMQQDIIKERVQFILTSNDSPEQKTNSLSNLFQTLMKYKESTVWATILDNCPLPVQKAIIDKATQSELESNVLTPLLKHGSVVSCQIVIELMKANDDQDRINSIIHFSMSDIKENAAQDTVITAAAKLLEAVHKTKDLNHRAHSIAILKEVPKEALPALAEHLAKKSPGLHEVLTKMNLIAKGDEAPNLHC